MKQFIELSSTLCLDDLSSRCRSLFILLRGADFPHFILRDLSHHLGDETALYNHLCFLIRHWPIYREYDRENNKSYHGEFPYVKS